MPPLNNPKLTADLPLVELAGTYLKITCTIGCMPMQGIVATKWINHLIEQLGPHTALGAVLGRLVCQRCGHCPTQVILTNSQTYGAYGAAAAGENWGIDLTDEMMNRQRQRLNRIARLGNDDPRTPITRHPRGRR